jgi:putative Mn2+ efflux pump MntP
MNKKYIILLLNLRLLILMRFVHKKEGWIMHLIYLFFIAIINSIDNMGIGVVYSIAGIRVTLPKNILISFLAFAISCVSSLTGGFISHYLNKQTSSIIGMLILVFMGTRMIYLSFSEKKDNNVDMVKILGFKEAIMIGIVLALDDIGSSVSSGLIGYNPLLVALPYFIVSFIIFFFGNYGTRFFLKLNIGKKATIISGSIMVTIGILQFFG